MGALNPVFFLDSRLRACAFAGMTKKAFPALFQHPIKGLQRPQFAAFEEKVDQVWEVFHR